MKITNGRIFIFFGICHSLLGVSPFAFGEQFTDFANNYFFNISEGLFEFPLMNGQMDFANFAAFWFCYFGLLLVSVGILVSYIEKTNHQLQGNFIWTYLIIVIIGVYMIPFSGMTFLMLPHAIYMVMQRQKKSQYKEEKHLNI